MSFDQSVITSGPTCTQAPNHELRASWTSSAPAGTTFQVYLDRRLAYSGTARSATFPLGIDRRRIWVGAVAPGEEATDFGPTLIDPLGDGDRANLSWKGGRYLSPDLASFAISTNTFGSGGFGAIPFGSTPLGTVPATRFGIWPDGFGRGRFGEGGFGHAEISYRWQSGPLATGTWHLAVAPIDSAGNAGPAIAADVTIASPPRPPAPPGPGMGRLAYGYVTSTRTLTLTWNPSPG